MELTLDFKKKIATALVEARNNYGGSEAHFASTKGLSAAQYSRLKNGQIDQLLSPTAWIALARQLDVTLSKRTHKIVRTEVYNEIEESIKFCQEFHKSIILVDETGIGKTACAKHICSKLKNAFYIDCSQAKSRIQFMKLLARTLGIETALKSRGNRYIDIKENVKYTLANILQNPIIILDEAGDLDYASFLDIKELWNASEDACGWFMMGADGLRNKIETGMKYNRVGFAELFSRFSDEYISIIPTVEEDRKAFYNQMILDIVKANGDVAKAAQYARACVSKGKSLRHLDTLLKLDANG